MVLRQARETEILPAMNMSKIRSVIIGTGGIARAHLDAIRLNGDLFELSGVFDPNPARAEAFCKEAGLDRPAASVEALLAAAKPDLVQICTPPAFHVSLSVQAMEAGACVLCEKPLCGSLADLDRIADAEQRTGKWCASVFQIRYGAATRHVQNLLRNGHLGAPLVCVCHTLWYRASNYYDAAWRGLWQNELGGPTVGHGIHAMDHILSMLGDWSEVRADIGTLDRTIEMEDVSMAIVRFANGAMASIVNSLLSPREETYLRMDFQKATVELRHVYGYDNENWTFSPGLGTDEAFAKTLRDIPESGRASHAAQLRAIAEDFRAGRTPETAGESARTILDLISAIYKSAMTGRPVARRSIRPGDPFYEAFHGGQAVPHRLTAPTKFPSP